MPRKSKEQEKKERQYKKQNDWNKVNTKTFLLKLSKDKQSKLIAFLEAKPNKSGYIASLIENDMKAGK